MKGNAHTASSSLLKCIRNHPQICAPLCIQPEIRGIAEDLRQNECGISGNRSPIAAEFIHMLSRQTGTLSQFGLGEAQWLKKLLDKQCPCGYRLFLCQ
jgi:hypothetical protein